MNKTQKELPNERTIIRKVGEYKLEHFPKWVKGQEEAHNFAKKALYYKNICIKVLNENNTVKDIEYLCKLADFSKTVFYEYMPLGSDYYNEIKDHIRKNKALLAQSLFEKMLDSDNATLTAMAYKLVCSDEDLERVSTNTNRHSGEIKHNVGVMESINIEYKVHNRKGN